MHALAVLAAVALAASPAKTKVAILDIGAPEGRTDSAKLLTQVVVAELAKEPALSVISSQEIAAAVGLERQRQLLGCQEDSCLAEIGGALGVEFIVTGQMGKLGSRFRLDLRLVRARDGRLAGSVGDFIEGNEDALADATVRLSRALLDQLRAQLKPSAAATVPPPSLPPETAVTATNPPPTPAGGLTQTVPAPAAGPSHTSAYVCWGVAAGLAAAATAMTLVTIGTYNDVADSTKTLDQSKADSLKWKGPVADALWVGAIGTAAAGTYLYFSAAPAGSGGELAIGGRF